MELAADLDPTVSDLRTHHEALPVLSGFKYAVNAWVHLYDWQTPAARQCPSVFDSGQHGPEDDLEAFLQAHRRAGLVPEVPRSMAAHESGD